MTLNKRQTNLLANFWMNVAVAWLIAASVSEAYLLTRVSYIAIMVIAMYFALVLKK